MAETRLETIADFSWMQSWGVGLPMLLASVAVHIGGLSLIAQLVGTMMRRVRSRGIDRPQFSIIMLIATALITMLHGAESWFWAMGYYLLGASPNLKEAMLYSLEAMTAYGHANVHLRAPWRLLGGLEALAGLMLMGLTTAFLYAIIQRVRPFQGMDPLHSRRPAAESELPR